MNEKLILVTGGVRAGKSEFALNLAREAGRGVLFCATAEAKDEEMEQRIRRHRAARPPEWQTLEEPVEVPQAINEALRQPGSESVEVVLLDCLNLWVTNLLLAGELDGSGDAASAAIHGRVGKLLESYERSTATFIVVTNEVGMGLVPPNELGRRFVDALGWANQMVAAKADEVYLVVSGVAVELKALGRS